MARQPKKPTRRVPPLADPTETIEHLISRRRLKIQPGDVVLSRLHGGQSLKRELFELCVVGGSHPPERFATFEHGAARGELLAANVGGRLFFVESASRLPYLLKDAKRSDRG